MLFGKDTLSMLEGMFAFCIYDQESKSFFLARDKFGEKPLYYFRDNQKVIFSSEIKSLITSKAFKPILRKEKLGSYIRMGYVEEPNTLLQNVFSLPPSSYMTISNNFDIDVKKYSSIAYKKLQITLSLISRKQ
jgi:asparagine synthase (glutamine-hydrolysing)